MKKRIVRLEQALKLWEDMCFLSGLRIKVKCQEDEGIIPKKELGPINHFADFRQHVVEKATEGDFDYERFIGSPEILDRVLGNTGSVPLDIFSWNHFSRRVFHLNHDLQTLLSATSLDGITWEDVKWPFKSFLLVLDEPICDNKTGNQYDNILLSNWSRVIKGWEQLDSYNFLLLSKNLDDLKFFDREKLTKMATPRKWNKEKMKRKAFNLSFRFLDRFFVTLKGADGKNTEPVNRPCEESFAEYREYLKQKGLVPNVPYERDEYEDCSVYDKAKHLIVSTCLYLSTLPPKKFPADWQPGKNEREQEVVGEFSPAAITTTNDIFTISCESTLSQESQETIAEIKQSRISREKCPHWRRGHWRKVWGGKDNPDAPKIWILPCLVNKQRLPPNSLPTSSKTILV